jgi:hypothetical protein
MAGAGGTSADADSATDKLGGASMGLAELIDADGTSSTGEGLGETQADNARTNAATKGRSFMGSANNGFNEFVLVQVAKTLDDEPNGSRQEQRFVLLQFGKTHCRGTD